MLQKVFQVCDPKEQERRVLTYILLFIGLGFLMLITMFLQVKRKWNCSLKHLIQFQFRVFSLQHQVKHWRSVFVPGFFVLYCGKRLLTLIKQKIAQVHCVPVLLLKRPMFKGYVLNGLDLCILLSKCFIGNWYSHWYYVTKHLKSWCRNYSSIRLRLVIDFDYASFRSIEIRFI